MRDVFGWNYPAGAENDPNAPWNAVYADEEPCECGEDKPEGDEFCGPCAKLEKEANEYAEKMGK